MTDRRPGAFFLMDGPLEVEVWPDPTFTSRPADDPWRYNREFAVADEHRQAIGMEVRVQGEPVASAVLLVPAAVRMSRTAAW